MSTSINPSLLSTGCLATAYSHGRRSFGAALLALVATACSRNYSTEVDEATGHQKVYRLSDDEAIAVAQNAIVRSFPGRKVEEIEGPTRGYLTYTRVLLDTFTQQVLAHPVTGTTVTGAFVDGYTFEVSGSGTSGTGAMQNDGFFRLLQADLDKTGKAVEVVSIKPRFIAARPKARTPSGDPIDQLARLKELLDKRAITPAEYEAKKAELLRRL